MMPILGIAAAAGCRSFTAIGEWAADAPLSVLRLVGAHTALDLTSLTNQRAHPHTVDVERLPARAEGRHDLVPVAVVEPGSRVDGLRVARPHAEVHPAVDSASMGISENLISDPDFAS